MPGPRRELVLAFWGSLWVTTTSRWHGETTEGEATQVFTHVYIAASAPSHF